MTLERLLAGMQQLMLTPLLITPLREIFVNLTSDNAEEVSFSKLCRETLQWYLEISPFQTCECR